MSLLEYFLTEDCFAVVPILVARKLRGGTLPVCRLEDGPEDVVIYYLTWGGEKQELIDRLLDMLHDALLREAGIHSFLQKP